MILFGWVGFYGISTIVGYLILNPLYKYKSNIRMSFVDNVAEQAGALFFCTQLNSFKYCHITVQI